MGMQTAVEDELRLLGRIHSIDDAKTLLKGLKVRDLIIFHLI